MSFLQQSFLWGLLAASIPIIIHLLNRRRHQTVQWAAMEFLLKATRESRGKKKLKYLLLLAARIALLALLAIAFSKPFLTAPPSVVTTTEAGTRVVLEEHKLKQQQGRPVGQSAVRESNPALEYHWEDGSDHDNDYDELSLSTHAIREKEHQKAQETLLESLQVEALWKICKIDLDRTVREACTELLKGRSFYTATTDHGWVGANHGVIAAEAGRLRAAALLVRMGKIMVQRSKEGTAWME